MRKNINNRVLLLEDDTDLSNTIVDYLTPKGYDVTQAYDGLEAGDMIYENSYSVLLFDVNVPFLSGFELLGEIRKNGVTTPIIMLTSVDDANSVEKAFNLGCDDYIRKPFALKELLVRIESIVKRSFSHNQSTAIELGNRYSYDYSSHQLFCGTKELKLKTKEHMLLQYMLQNKNKILTKDDIFGHIYDYDEESSEGSLRAYIKSIRGHLGKECISTIKNVGYVYVGC